MAGKGKESGPETASSLLAKAKTTFSEALAEERGDGEKLISSFTALESAMGAATKANIITPGENFDELHHASVVAVDVAERSGDATAKTYFAAKQQTYESLRDTIALPAEVLPPQATVTEEREMSGGKAPV